jgi:chemotaxis protein MotA
MTFIIGFVIVIGSILGGYTMHHGNMAVLNQPSEFVIIGGSGIGAFIIANPPHIIKKVLKSLKNLLKAKPYNQAQYIELLTMMFNVFKIMKTKGLLELESHIENPSESDIFNQYPSFMANHHAVHLFTDYLRLVSMGVEDSMQVEDIIEKELEAHHKADHEVGHAVIILAESFPALGIVAAVLGVIVTMGSITEPPEILGGLIGAALVGTFLGVLLCYGIVGPMGNYISKFGEESGQYYECIKIALVSHLKGNAPAVSVEFARKVIPEHVQPSFVEVEEAMSSVG